MMRLIVRGLAILSAGLAAGCTHTQLRWNTVHQAQSLSEVYQNQVLNNLAKFVYDPNSLPDFSFPNQGTSAVEDSGKLDLLFTWLWTGTGQNGLTGNLTRSSKESWVLVPLTDPRKLELMRCAYQRAVASCCAGAESGDCPDCMKRWNAFYTGEPYGRDNEGKPVYARWDIVPEPGKYPEPKPEDKKEPVPIPDAGIVTSRCLNATCWFHVGTKKDVPRNCPRTHIGHYCGVYVWVFPGEGTNELTKLTLAILDYAVNEPARVPQKEVEVQWEYVDKKPTIKSWKEKYFANPAAQPKPPTSGQERTWTDQRLTPPSLMPPEATLVLPGGRSPEPSAGILLFEEQRRALAPF